MVGVSMALLLRQTQISTFEINRNIEKIKSIFQSPFRLYRFRSDCGRFWSGQYWLVYERRLFKGFYWALGLLFESFNRGGWRFIINLHQGKLRVVKCSFYFCVLLIYILNLNKCKLYKEKKKRMSFLLPCDYDQQQQEEMAVNGCKAPEISFSAKNKRYRVAREQSWNTFCTTELLAI